MGSLLKPLIIIQLLISIAALVLGVMLFQQREVLKGRTQVLEKAADRVAKAIHHDEFNVASIKDYTRMKKPLDDLVAMGQYRWTELQDTIQELDNTKADLAQTKLDLASTKDELNSANNQIAQLSDTLNQREAELAQASSRITELETETAELNTQVEDMTAQFAEMEEEYEDLEANYDSLRTDYDKLVGEFQGSAAARGLAGKILLVNSDWNFVILDIGTDEGLTPAAEMLVHRSDNLVGRVRVSTVNDRMAVAEILPGWKEKPIREGDFVISPES